MTTLFAIVAALLVLAALAGVLLPLLRNRPAAAAGDSVRRLDAMAANQRELDDELAAHALGRDEYDEARRELERQALEADSAGQDRRPVITRRAVWASIIAIGVAVPVAAAGLYFALGQPAAIAVGPGASGPVATSTDPSKVDPRVTAMMDELGKHLKQHPDDAEGWLMMARSRTAIGEPQLAIKAYQRAASLRPTDANLLAEYAYTAGVANGHNLSGQPRKLLDRALQLDPDNPNALALAGEAALQAGRNDEAIKYWTHLEKVVPPNSEGLAQLKTLIAQTRSGGAAAAGAGVAISGTVIVSPALAAEVAPTDTVFVFARAAGGRAPTPVAVVRSSAANMPVAFTLDDADAMTPQARLSQFANVDLFARISRTGSANAQPGDLQGEVDRVSVGSSHIRIVVDRPLDQ